MADEIKFSERKLKSLEKARSLFGTYWKDGSGRRDACSKILNQLNGGKPFSDSDLDAAGQGWRTNINFRDASSTLEQVLISYWRMLHDVTNLAIFEVESDDRNKDGWEQTFQKAFDDFHDDWGPGYVRNYLLMSSYHVGLGSGTGYFKNESSPRWEALRIDEVLVPARTKADPEALGEVILRQEVTVSDLYGYIRTPQAEAAAAAVGWNPDAIRKLLYCATNVGQKVKNDDYLKVQDAIRDNVSFFDATTANIQLVHVLTKEWDGSITRVSFPETLETDDKEQFLFDNYGVPSNAKKFEQLIFTIFFEAGDGLWYGSKGFGHKNYGLALTLNRLKSRAVDRTLIDGINLKDNSDSAQDTIPILNIGPFNILPRYVEQLPNYPTGRSILETIGMIEANQSYNNARFKDQANQIAGSNTATEANILSNLQSQVDVANATLYLQQIARNVFTEQFRRLRKKGSTDADAKEFFRRCVTVGKMPEEIYYDAPVKMTTGADPGTASASLRAQIASQLMAASAGNRHIDDRAATEGFVANTLGASAVKKYLRPVGEEEDPSAVRLAILENGTMGDGIPVPVPPNDPHETHLPVHLQPLKVMVDSFRQTGALQPEQLIALQNAIPHCDQHFAILKQDKLRQAQYQQLWPVFAQIKAQASAMFSQLQKMHEQAQMEGQPGADPRAGDPSQAMSNTPGPVGAGAFQ